MKAFAKARSRQIRFESFELDLDTGELRKNGRRVRLQDQPGKLLTLLAARPGELVTRQEIQSTLWEEGRFVEFDHAVNTAVKKVREALEDDPEAPRIIETLPRKGYRFIASVEWVEEQPLESPQEVIVPVEAVEELLPSVPSVEVRPALTEPEVETVPLPAQDRRHRSPLLWILAMVSLLLLVAAGFALRNAISPPSNIFPEMRVEVTTPSTADPTSVAISPDGLKIVYVAISEGRSQLRLRLLDTGVERSLPGTDGALFPFWSANNRSVGFFADGSLKRTDIDGGLPRILADAPAGRGGSWNREDVILFTPNAGGPIFRVSATGDGEPMPLTEIGAGSHRHPRFLPD